MTPAPIPDQLAVQALLAEYGGLLDLGHYDEWIALFAASAATRSCRAKTTRQACRSP